MGNALVPFTDGIKDLRVRSTAVLKRESMETQDGTATYAVLTTLSGIVVNSTGSTIAAFNATQRDQVLAGIKLTLSQYLGKGVAERQPFQAEPLTVIRDEAKFQLERDFVGVDDATTGLAQPWESGNNPFAITVIVPLGHIECIDEGQYISGLGPEQMADLEMTLEMLADPFKSVNANLKLADDKLSTASAPEWRESYGIAVGEMVFSRKVVAAESDTVETEAGMVLGFWDMANPLSSTDLQTIRVSVGRTVVVDSPNTPADVQAAYERKPDTGVVEASLEDHRTPCYVLADGPLERVPVGPVTAKQVQYIRDWQGRTSYIPTPTTATITALATRIAAQLSVEDSHVLLVSNATVRKLSCTDKHLPFVGATGFVPSQREFFDYAGLLVPRNGTPKVYIPPHLKRQYVQRMILAATPSAEYPNGDTGKLESITREAAAGIPGGVINEMEGMKDPSWVYAEVKKLLDAALQEERTRLMTMGAAQTAAVNAAAVAAVKAELAKR